MLKVYNSLTAVKEDFKPLIPGKISLYVCGNTVYDYCHIGHARSMILFDVMVRYLRAQGNQVIYVRNITDIDDKIIKRAQENSESITALTDRFIQAQREDEQALGLLPPDHEPRATEYIEQMQKLIQQLVEKQYAYVADNGDVCFEVRRFPAYGQLSGRDVDKLRAGARVELTDVKRDPLDFVLWKISKPGEPVWPSPWGAGRPGWHIECSAMAGYLLGQPFDIHGGGMDLKFPHHENEITQSEAACGKQFARHWLHIGLLQVNKEKMSKSLNNFVTIRQALEIHHPEVLRYFMISGHYRSPVNYSTDNMAQAHHALAHLYLALRDLPMREEKELSEQYHQAFQAAMDDDFNTPQALAVLFDLAREINRLREQKQRTQAATLAFTLKHLGGILGILQHPVEIFLRGSASTDENAEIEFLIKQRDQARESKNWQEADKIRKKLQEMGIIVEDNAVSGTSWRRG